jgi:hypothetical protein
LLNEGVFGKNKTSDETSSIITKKQNAKSPMEKTKVLETGEGANGKIKGGKHAALLS